MSFHHAGWGSCQNSAGPWEYLIVDVGKTIDGTYPQDSRNVCSKHAPARRILTPHTALDCCSPSYSAPAAVVIFTGSVGTWFSAISRISTNNFTLRDGKHTVRKKLSCYAVNSTNKFGAFGILISQVGHQPKKIRSLRKKLNIFWESWDHILRLRVGHFVKRELLEISGEKV